MNDTVWQRFCERLQAAGSVLASPGAPQDPLNQAEGVRYLSRLIRLGLEIHLEGGDPDFPAFMMPSHETAKMGGDNPDNRYLSATIAGDRVYRLCGNIGTVTYLSLGSKANRYGLDGTMPSTGELSRDQLQADARGDFTVIASATRPHDPSVAWLPLAADSTMLQLRQTFLDRRRETAATITIERISPGPAAPAPLDPRHLEQRLMAAADFVSGTSRLFAGWASMFMSHPNQLRDWGQDMFIKAGGDPAIFYVHGYWKLGANEALVIETDIPACEHWNLQVNNWWMESLDYRYHPVCVNKSSARLSPEGRATIVIAPHDPGFGNWLTTAGHSEGFVLLRWVRASDTPIPSARVISLA